MLEDWSVGVMEWKRVGGWIVGVMERRRNGVVEWWSGGMMEWQMENDPFPVSDL
jgi:hypothetical protein